MSRKWYNSFSVRLASGAFLVLLLVAVTLLVLRNGNAEELPVLGPTPIPIVVLPIPTTLPQPTETPAFPTPTPMSVSITTPVATFTPSSTPVVLQSSVNLPPVIEYPSEGKIVLVRWGSKVRIQVKAYDPEGKPVYYTLTGGNPVGIGMEIDQAGLISWDMPYAEKYRARRIMLTLVVWDDPARTLQSRSFRTFFVETDF